MSESKKLVRPKNQFQILKHAIEFKLLKCYAINIIEFILKRNPVQSYPPGQLMFLVVILELFVLFANFGTSSHFHKESIDIKDCKKDDKYLAEDFEMLEELLPETIFSEPAQDPSSSGFTELKCFEKENVKEIYNSPTESLKFDDYPENQELYNMLQAENSDGLNLSRDRSELVANLKSRRSKVYSMLLEIYREQVDSTATRLPWGNVTIINYPIESDKTKPHQWPY